MASAMKSDALYTSGAGADLPMMVHVTAPATLPAGYTFEAEINGDPSKLFTCEVVRAALCFCRLYVHVL
jgi:hypothetical protein